MFYINIKKINLIFFYKHTEVTAVRVKALWLTWLKKKIKAMFHTISIIQSNKAITVKVRIY